MTHATTPRFSKCLTPVRQPTHDVHARRAVTHILRRHAARAPFGGDPSTTRVERSLLDPDDAPKTGERARGNAQKSSTLMGPNKPEELPKTIDASTRQRGRLVVAGNRVLATTPPIFAVSTRETPRRPTGNYRAHVAVERRSCAPDASRRSREPCVRRPFAALPPAGTNSARGALMNRDRALARIGRQEDPWT